MISLFPNKGEALDQTAMGNDLVAGLSGDVRLPVGATSVSIWGSRADIAVWNERNAQEVERAIEEIPGALSFYDFHEVATSRMQVFTTGTIALGSAATGVSARAVRPINGEAVAATMAEIGRRVGAAGTQVTVVSSASRTTLQVVVAGVALRAVIDAFGAAVARATNTAPGGLEFATVMTFS